MHFHLKKIPKRQMQKLPKLVKNTK